MSYGTKDDVPYINDKPCAPCNDNDCNHLGGAFAPWKCPECSAHLGRSLICLNACHLTNDSRARFSRIMGSLGKGDGDATR